VHIDHPADKREPRRICVYLVDVLDAAQIGEDGKKFKFDPERLLYALRWKHRAAPADVKLVLVRERNPSRIWPFASERITNANPSLSRYCGHW
jgi:hypothetical protein